jgi:pimeloyl-ACP methyl ester carboxylesterase
MPQMRINGAGIHYEEVGRGRETIVFAHGLLFSGRMFEGQVRALRDRYRCITFDFRGQGQSEVTPSGYNMDILTEDAAGLIEALGCAPCHFVGLSMGGFVGMRLAARRPTLLRSLVLLETSADPEPKENIGPYRRLNLVARWLGVRPVAGRVLKILFGRRFLEDPARDLLKEEWRRRLIANNRIGITRAVTAVIDRAGVYDEIGRIALPTLIIVGDQDIATPPTKAERIRGRIPGSRLVVIPGAGHSSVIEEPEAVTRALAEFLDELGVSARPPS